MRNALARCVLVMAAGFVLSMGQGCKSRPAPVAVQPVVRVVPRRAILTDASFPNDDVPVAPDGGTVRGVRSAVTPPPVTTPPPVAVQDPNAVAAAAAEAQRRQDAMLLEQQQAASRRQQQELDEEVRLSTEATQRMEAEPRIQDSPPAPQWSFQPGEGAPEQENDSRIQDAPGPAETLHQLPQGAEPPRVQDAPGPAQMQSQQ